MAQHRQSGFDRVGVRSHDFQQGNGAVDHVSVAIRGPPYKQFRNRRFKSRKVSIGAVILLLSLVFVASVLGFVYLSGDKEISDGAEKSGYQDDTDDVRNDPDFLTNVTRTQSVRVLEFGHGSVAHGRDSRDWEDKDDRRRDDDYSEDVSEHASEGGRDGVSDKVSVSLKAKEGDKKSPVDGSHKVLDHKGVGMYNEAGRGELRMYEEEYEANLKNGGKTRDGNSNLNRLSNVGEGIENKEVKFEDEYDDVNPIDDTPEDYDVSDHEDEYHSDVEKFYETDSRESSHGIIKDEDDAEAVDEVATGLSDEDSPLGSDKLNANSGHESVSDGQSSRKSSSEKRSKKKPKRRKTSGSCDMKFLNSTAKLVEPLESRKFARFSLQYKGFEEKPNGQEHWEPRFAGHQNSQQREDSFFARDQKINCGFVKGPKESPSTGFDLAEDDAKYISTCHIAVISCIFGNSDRLRTPMGKTVSRLSKKNVCFVLFVDDITLQTLSSEGQMPDRMGFVGIWKIVVVKNLPYTDMRRVGKIPKLLPHRLFPSARYSIWLDSKLRLQLDPLLILEYFLWRKGYEYAISNHYDRHCVWQEVAQNKKLNKYNHSIIDQQFAFYQADGLRRFNASDPNKLLPSNVPEGSFIVRAHTPMSNLFSCLWYNEVELFTPRDQLSFAYTYHKLRSMNPSKPFYLNMFKDCERRKIAKLFRHRSEETRNILRHVT